MSSGALEVFGEDCFDDFFGMELQVLEILTELVSAAPLPFKGVDRAIHTVEHQVPEDRHDIVGTSIRPRVQDRLPLLALRAFL